MFDLKKFLDDFSRPMRQSLGQAGQAVAQTVQPSRQQPQAKAQPARTPAPQRSKVISNPAMGAQPLVSNRMNNQAFKPPAPMQVTHMKPGEVSSSQKYLNSIGAGVAGIAQGTARIPEEVFRSAILEPLVGNAGAQNPISTASAPNTGIRKILYGEAPVKAWQETARDVGASLKNSDNEFLRGAAPAAPFIAPALAALNLSPGGFATASIKGEVKNAAVRGIEKSVNPRGAIDDAIETAIKSQPAKTPAPSTVLDDIIPTQKQRGFMQSVQGSPEVSDTLKSAVAPQRYDVRNTAKLAADADAYSRKPLKRVQTEVNDRLSVRTGQIDDQTIAESIAVAKRLDSKGNFDGANQIYERLAEHGTKGGQAIQAFSLLSNRTPEGMQYYAARTLKKHGVQLDEPAKKELQALVNAVKKTKPDTEARKMATHQVSQFVNGRLPTGVADKAVNLWRAGLLTSPTTTAGNLLGNATEAVTRGLWTNPVAVGADKLMSLATGKRTKTLAGGNLQGAAEGFDKLKTYMKTGYDERNSLAKFDVKEVNYGNSAIGKGAKAYTDTVYKLMSAADQPFFYAARNQAMRDIAGAEALNKGLKGVEKKNFIDQLVQNPDSKLLDAATKSAEYATYQNKTGLGTAISGAKQSLRNHSEAGGAALDYIVPFTQVPASVAMRIVDRLGAGVAKELWTLTPFSKGKFDQRRMAEAIGNGSFGPAMIAAGTQLANTGNITFGYPEDPKEAELWKMEGKQPYSVRLGDRWYSLNYMQPFGTLLAMGGQIKDAQDEGAEPATQVSQGVATAGQSIMNQSFLKGVSGILDAVDDPKRYAENLWENTTGSVVPNVVRAGVRSADPVQRDAKGPLEGLMSSLPGARQQLPAKTDAFGKPLPAKDNFLNQFVNPLRPSIARDSDQVVGELRRLQDTENGTLPSDINKNALGKDIALTREQMSGLKTQVGPKVYEAWNSVMADPRYKALSDADKKSILDKVKNTVAGGEKARFATDSGLKKPEDVADTLTTKERDYLTGNSSDAMTTATTKAKKTYKDKYDQAQSDWNKNQGKYSDIEKIEKEKELTRLKVQKDYPEDIIDLYGMSKADAWKFVSEHPNGKAMADKLVEYGDKLKEAGVYAYSKYRDKNGNVSVQPAAKKASSKKASGTRKSTAKGGKAKKGKTFKPPASTANTGTTRKLASLRRSAKLNRRNTA
jgi:hypothetical protein